MAACSCADSLPISLSTTFHMSNTSLIDVVVQRRQMQGQSVAVLELAAARGGSLPPFTAGAHIDVHLRNGLIRQYSLCSDPREHSVYRLGVLRDAESRGGSIAVHEDLTTGAPLRIGSPRNHFPLAASASHHVLVGGGIGVTPMLAMAWALHAEGKSFELHYCARNQESAAFVEELQAVPWKQQVRMYFGDKLKAGGFEPMQVLRSAPEGRHVYVCGPQGFMAWVMEEASQAGLGSAEIHREYFSAPTSSEGNAPDRPFEVIASRSGRTTTVAAGQTLLSALRSIGVQVPVSCEEGVCGTCACTVLEGTPDHRDAYLTEEERAANDQIMVCCSRSSTDRLVLDI